MKRFNTLDLAYIGLSAAIIAICSWVTIPVGTIPVTLQTMAVCLVSGIFGLKRGLFATLVYIVLGAAGVPVFSGFKGGAGVLLGATGGYIIGFIFTAIITGIASDKTDKLPILAASMLLGIAVCYAFGTVWFMFVYSKETSIGLSKTLTLCVTPFIIPDIIKITVASLLTARLKKHIKGRKSYENETQKKSGNEA